MGLSRFSGNLQVWKSETLNNLGFPDHFTPGCAAPPSRFFFFYFGPPKSGSILVDERVSDVNSGPTSLLRLFGVRNLTGGASMFRQKLTSMINHPPSRWTRFWKTGFWKTDPVWTSVWPIGLQ